MGARSQLRSQVLGWVMGPKLRGILMIAAVAFAMCAMPSASAQVPSTSAVLVEVANELVGIGEFDAAVEHLWQAVRQDTDCDECLQRLSEILAARSEYDHARLAYERGLRESAAERVSTANNLFAEALGDGQQAQDLLTTARDATRSDRDRAAAWVELGRRFQALALLDAAADQYAAALAILPDDAEALDARASLHRVQAEAYFKAGYRLERIGYYQEARRYLSQATSILPDYTTAWAALAELPSTEAEANYKLGQLYQTKGLYEEARQMYAAALLADPENKGARQALESVPVEPGLRGIARVLLGSRLDILVDGVVILVVSAVISVWIRRRRAHRIVVDAFENVTGKKEFDIGPGLARAVSGELARCGLQPEEQTTAPPLPELLTTVDRPLAQLVRGALPMVLQQRGVRVTGVLRVGSHPENGYNTLCADIQVIDLKSGRMIKAQTVCVTPLDDSAAALDSLVEKIGVQLYYSGVLFSRNRRGTTDEASFDYFMEGLKYHRGKELAKANEAYTNAIAVDPANSLAHLDLGLIQLQFGQEPMEDAARADWYRKAIDSFRQAQIHIQRIPPEMRFRVYQGWGQALLEGEEDFEEASRRFDTALKAAQKSKQPVETQWEIELRKVQALVETAQAQGDQRAKDEARQIVDRIKCRGTRNPWLLFMLAMALVKFGETEFEDASEKLEVAIRHQPNWFAYVMQEDLKPLRSSSAWCDRLGQLLLDSVVQLNVNEAIEEELICALGSGPARRVIQARERTLNQQLTEDQFWGAAGLSRKARWECENIKRQIELDIKKAAESKLAHVFGRCPARRVIKARQERPGQRFTKMSQVWQAAKLDESRRRECEGKMVI